MITETQRTVLRIGAGFIVAGAVLALLYGIFLPGAGGGDEEPIPVPAGQRVELPGGRTLLGGASTVLWGDVPGDEPVEPEDIGCVLRDEDGERARDILMWGLSLTDERRTVDGVQVRPLLEIRKYDTGWTVQCDLASARPLYLMDGGTNGLTSTFARVGALGAGAVGLVVGIAGLLYLRPRRRD